MNQQPAIFKYILILLLFINTNTIYSQITQTNNVSPNGYFDNVFDNYGNSYNLKDINYQQSRTLSNGVTSTTNLIVDSGYFKLFFEIGCGMEGTSIQETARRNILIQAFQDISNFIPSPLTTNGLNNKVNIWVRSFDNMPSNIPSNVSKSSSFYSFPNSPSNYTNYGGIIDNEIWKTIHLGVDSYTNIIPNIVSINPSNPNPFFPSSEIYHGIIAFNFNNNNWNENLNLAANSSQYDLYTEALHQITHLLGFESLINYGANSIFNSNGSFFSRYDTFLKTNNNLALLTSLSPCIDMYDNKSNSIAFNAIHPNLTNCQTNTTNCSTALNFVGTSPSASITVPFYTPNCWENFISLSHFEDSCFTAPSGFTSGNDLYFTMSNLNTMGTNKRFLKNEERLALVNLGYSVTSNYGVSSTLNGFIVNNTIYGATAISGVTVAGLNDGITNEGSFLYIGYTGQPIVINSATNANRRILFNDYNASNFQCIQDLTDTNAIISNTSGSNLTDSTITSNVAGLHILRYVPINSTGKGNITYIYVYIQNSSTATASTCSVNLVNNGDFEQYNLLPTVTTQIERVKGWYRINPSTPDYYNALSNISTNVSVPCNLVGYETDKIPNNKGYAGFVFYKNLDTGFTSMEILKTKLNAPLASNTTYQVSFDVSLAEKYNYSTNMQAYFSKDDYYMAFNEESIPILNNAMLFSNPTISTTRNGWQTITFNFTTGAVAGEEFLYLGHFIDVQNTLETPASLGINGCTNYSLSQLNSAYYYLDNVSVVNLIALNGATFSPVTLCSNQSLPNLTAFLASCPTNGVFSGNGVIYNSVTGLYSFQFPNGVTSSMVSYSYTNASGCSLTLNSTFTATNPINPTFNPIPAFCQGSTPPILPTTSTNGITGTWNPSTVSNTTSGSYTFTPTVGQCATVVSVTTTVTIPTITPTFNPIAVLCQGSTPPVLPTTSTNSITGTWSPSTVSTTASGNYTFTPNAGQCAVAVSRAIQVLPNTAFVTNADAFVVTLGSYVTTNVTTPSVLINDTYNGGAIPATIAGIPYSIGLTGTAPTIPAGGITFNAATGIFTVLPNTTAGTYVYQYYLHNNCYNTPVKTVKIVVDRLLYENRIGLSFCYGTTGANSGTTLYLGTSVNGVLANSTNATISLVAPTTTLPTGITSISPNGSVNLAAGVLPGQITFYYKICSNSTGSCTVPKTCVITIESTVRAYPDPITANANGAITYNVLSNDSYRGTCSSTGLVPATVGTGGNVTLTQIAPFSSYYSILPSGAIFPAGNPPAGTYILSYKLCDAVYNTFCQNVNVVITVPSSKMAAISNTAIFDLNKVTITPNPSDGLFTVYFNNNIKEANIEIYTMLGQKIDSININNSSQYDYENSRLASGTYLIKISCNEESISKRIIIK